MEQRRGDASGGEEEGQEELGQGAAAAAMHLQHVASAFAKVAKRISAPCPISLGFDMARAAFAIKRCLTALQVARCDLGAGLLCRPRVRDALVAMAHAADDDQTLQVCSRITRHASRASVTARAVREQLPVQDGPPAHGRTPPRARVCELHPTPHPLRPPPIPSAPPFPPPIPSAPPSPSREHTTSTAFHPSVCRSQSAARDLRCPPAGV